MSAKRQIREDEVDRADKNGVTPLHSAARFKDPAAVRALLARGADVNRPCKRSGSTPLHRAVTFTGAPGTAGRQSEATEIVRLLIAAGADPTLRNRLGKRPADYTKDGEVLKILSEAPANGSAPRGGDRRA